MTAALSDSRLANVGAGALAEAFANHQDQFHAITARAKTCFEQRDWHGMQANATKRLDLYSQTVNQIVDSTRALLGARIDDKLVWASLKAVYSGLIAQRDDWELAETFFNSVTRRIFTTVGVDPQIEFVDTDFDSPPTPASRPIYRTYAWPGSTAMLIEALLADYDFASGYQDSARDAQLAAQQIEAHLHAISGTAEITRIEMLEAVFYRNKGAYLVGRIISGARIVPLVLALLHPPEGIVVDAVLLSEQDVNVLFSFTRSYFHVEAKRPYELVRFLSTITHQKRVADIYTSIGQNKHGKTELYRTLLHHLAHSSDQFEIASGERGMVMLVFTLPSFDVVFKVIKDRFAHPKTVTRRDVLEKYRLVFRHDRAGRLVDAQEFEHLQFERSRFSEPLLAELQRLAAQSVAIQGDYVIIHHAYVERRVTPLNLYVSNHTSAAAHTIVIDFGQTIKDLAASNIFPGDMLIKNFGVTRQGRVVFYDYDELCLLTSCVFRAMPQAMYDDEEFAVDPWFSVGEQDIFPAEFRQFLGLQGELRDCFIAHHADLFDVGYWQQIQQRLQRGELLDIFPYDQDRRLAQRAPDALIAALGASA